MVLDGTQWKLEFYFSNGHKLVKIYGDNVLRLRDKIEIVIQFLDRVHSRTLEYANKWIAQKVDSI